MIEEIIKRFNAKQEELEMQLSRAHPGNYKALVEIVVRLVTSELEYDDCNLDPERITEIDHGDYQGTLVYIIGEKGYQPSQYWYIKVAYGSCSACDTLQGISDYSSDPPTKKQIKEYLQLALHLVQGIKEL